jgi:hypothetical protein
MAACSMVNDAFLKGRGKERKRKEEKKNIIHAIWLLHEHTILRVVALYTRKKILYELFY